MVETSIASMLIDLLKGRIALPEKPQHWNCDHPTQPSPVTFIGIEKQGDFYGVEKNSITLPPEKFEAFQKALDEPTKPSPALHRLLAEPSVIEK